MIKRFTSFVFSFVLLVSISFGQEAYGVACGFTAGPVISGNIYDFDLSDGSETLIGPACSGELLVGEFINGVYHVADNTTQVVYTVNAAGTCTNVGSVSGISGSYTGFSWDPTTNTTYFMTFSGGTNLYTINTSTWVATLVGVIPGVPLGISLAIDNNSNAWVIDIALDAIVQIDLSSGATIGAPIPLTYAGGGGPVSLNFAQDTDFDCDDATGMLFGILYGGGGTGEYGSLDPATGEFTVIRFIGTEVCAFSINVTNEIVPTLGEWALIILGMSFLIFGVVAIRYRRRQTSVA